MVIYKSKEKINTRQFDATDFIASLCSHITNMGEQMVKYYGFYSNFYRGRRERGNCDGAGFIITDDEYKKGFSKSWARLIKKIYEVDPLICPKCGGHMRIIAFIEDYKVIKKILDYLGIYEFKGTGLRQENWQLLIHLMTTRVMTTRIAIIQIFREIIFLS